VFQTLKSCNTRHPNFPSLIEQLSTEVRQKVVKMSEARLRQKLVQAGYRVVDISTFDGATLLEYYAKVLLTETA